MSADDSSSPQNNTPDPAPAYRVLARKYRPQRFEDLIGQAPMVRTLTNAFAAGRIAHAFMLTGVRGVGKTTTARLLARALNYQAEGAGKDQGGPGMTLDPPGVHCAAIAASSHVDVMEMDAASHTGVDDIREILESVRYGPVSARYKVYIIDEVHMLSKQAFNALLKTLEEPPPHAIFIFATTEVRKVPVTVLSRCQRFDLARIGHEQLVSHLQGICQKEGVQVAFDGLALIARAAEGSVRDALSILDQALVQEQGRNEVSADDIRTMLGLADRTRVLELFALAARGDAAGCCTELQSQFEAGAEPLIVLHDLLDHCHQTSRAKVLGEALALEEYGASARLVRALAAELSLGQLARLWQMLLKALAEARLAPEPMSATEMALIRICAAATLPGPEDAARLLQNGEKHAGTAAPEGVPPPQASPVQSAGGGGPRAALQTRPETDPAAGPTPESPPGQPVRALQALEDIVLLLKENREMHLAALASRYVQLVSLRPGAMVFCPQKGAPDDLAPQLTRALRRLTGQSWLISLDAEAAEAAPTLAEQKKQTASARLQKIENSAQMHDILEAFPGAKIIAIETPDADKGENP